MNLLDMRTVIFCYAVSNLLCMIVMAILWKQNRTRFAGLGFWLGDFVMQFTALVLIAIRGKVPDVLSMTGSNSLIIGGTILMYIGLERFTGKRGPQRHNYMILAGFVLIHAYFVFVLPNMAVRTILFTVAVLAICYQCAWLMLRRVAPEMRAVTRGVGHVFIAFSLISAARIVVILAAPSGNDFFRSSVHDSLLLITYQMLFIYLTFSLALMVNRRLFTELERDMAARRRAEAIIQLRLILWEFAAEHSSKELMQKALDEIEALTDSLIGFYHFVEEEQKSLTLQAWSTRTINQYCKTEGEDMHYPLDKAGVWVDCVRVRRPVIHNDYASLPHRKGMPAGHAELVRELVVPTMRGGRVVSILGVGNKPGDYDERDVELVSYIADVVWTIVSQKRTDEQILRLNSQLERLAMTDELTGLANRRAFFIQGSEEMKRARRYETPLTLIMLDIDRFKEINDTYGHEAGDAVLQSIAGTLQKNGREVDVVARLGGEEFGILLPNTKAADAAVLAERLRLAIEKESCFMRKERIGVTASIGVATFSKEMPNLDALLRDADTAMYRAKNQGRNRVVLLV